MNRLELFLIFNSTISLGFKALGNERKVKLKKGIIYVFNEKEGSKETLYTLTYDNKLVCTFRKKDLSTVLQYGVLTANYTLATKLSVL